MVSVSERNWATTLAYWGTILLGVFICIDTNLFASLYNPHDRLMALAGANSLVEGYGVSLPYVTAANVDVVQHSPLKWWSEGGSLILGTLYLLTHHWGTSYSLFFILGVVLTLWGMDSALRLFSFPRWLSAAGLVLFLFNLEFFRLFYHVEGILLATSIWAFYFFARAIREGSWASMLFSGTLVGLTPLLKYAAFGQPVAFLAVTGLLFLTSVYQKDKKTWQLSLIGAASCLFFFGGYLLWMLLFRGMPPKHAGEPEAGRIYWEHLSYFHWGFVINALTAPMFQVLPIKLLGLAKWELLKSILSAVLLLGIGYWAIRHLIKQQSPKFELVFLAVHIAGTLAFLTYTSISNPLQHGNWTFLMEHRYYLVPMAYTFILLILLIGSWESLNKPSWLRTAFIGLAGLSVAAGLYQYKIEFSSNSALNIWRQQGLLQAPFMHDVEKIRSIYLAFPNKAKTTLFFDDFNCDLGFAAGMPGFEITDGGQKSSPLSKLHGLRPHDDLDIVLIINHDSIGNWQNSFALNHAQRQASLPISFRKGMLYDVYRVNVPAGQPIQFVGN